MARAPLMIERVPRAVLLVVAPLQAFFRLQAGSGIVLIVSAIVAMAWANSPWRESYHALTHLEVVLHFGSLAFDWTLHEATNEALMTVFFLMAGLEIKRELTVGELRSLDRAALPLIAAAGGMVVPALIYRLFNQTAPASRGWAMPMATDIAFALGCLSIVRRRIPTSLFVFLTALAIFDDLGAILVIAGAYGGTLETRALGAAAALTALLAVLGWWRVQRLWPYFIVGPLLWFAVLRSGLHATLAGVVLGLSVPAQGLRPAAEVLDDVDAELDDIRAQRRATEATGASEEFDSGAIAALERHLEWVQPPLDRMLHGIHAPVAYGIVPLFALVNAGVTLKSSPWALLQSTTALGVSLGLLLGKTIGVFGATWLAVRSGLAPMPTYATWLQVLGVSVMAGIGFTMSLFVGDLAFGAAHPLLADAGKVGIVAGSVAAAVIGLLVLWIAPQGAQARSLASSPTLGASADIT